MQVQQSRSDTIPSVKRRWRTINKERTAQEILGAADDFFCRIPYDRVSLRALAESVGHSTGSIFESHKDKESLFVAVLKLILDRQTDLMAEAHGKDFGIRFALSETLSVAYEDDDGYRQILRSATSRFYAGAPLVSRFLHTHRRLVRDHVADLLSEARKREDLDISDVTALLIMEALLAGHEQNIWSMLFNDLSGEECSTRLTHQINFIVAPFM